MNVRLPFGGAKQAHLTGGEMLFLGLRDTPPKNNKCHLEKGPFRMQSSSNQHFSTDIFVAALPFFFTILNGRSKSLI